MELPFYKKEDKSELLVAFLGGYRSAHYCGFGFSFLSPSLK
jgi:hypothetical protein